MKTITVSAPGKLMLFGEHSVVYGHPCIVTAVDQRLSLTIEIQKNQSGIQINAKDVDVENYKKSFDDLGTGEIPKGVRFVETALLNFFEKYPKMLQKVQKENLGFFIQTQSDFKATFGFGSSSASTVCVIKALSEIFGIGLSERELFDLSYKTVLDIQKSGSGFDVASAIYGGTIYFSGKDKQIETLNVSELPLIVGYSGQKADTATLIAEVSVRYTEEKEVIDSLFLLTTQAVNRAKDALVKKDWETLGVLMNQNQEYLKSLGVSTEMLDKMIFSAVESGAYGAKLSGAGGGDCMIAISSPGKQSHVCDSIENVGGEVIDVKTNAEGVRVEI